jgi:signal peptidase I
MEEGEHQAPQNEVPTTSLSPGAAVRHTARQAHGRLTKIALLALGIAAVVLLRLYVYESDVVDGNSMEPGLRSGDVVLLCKLGCGAKPPRRFEVVTFRAPESKEVLIKRVIALPDEWVWVWEDHVFVNGGRLEEPYVAKWRGQLGAPVYVPRRSIFVMGDNRDDSEDSRVWGPIPSSSVRGRAVVVFFPFSHAGFVR